MAAVARAVGTPGVQRVGYPFPLPAVPLHRDRTGGMPPPPPRHPAASFRRSPVPCCPAVGGRRHPCRAAGTPAAPFRWFVGRACRGLENTGTLLRCLALLGFGSAASALSVPALGWFGRWLEPRNTETAERRCVASALRWSGGRPRAERGRVSVAGTHSRPFVGTGGFVVAVDGRLCCRCGSASPVSGGRYRVPVRCTGRHVGAVGGGRGYWITGTPLLSVWASRRSPLASVLPRRFRRCSRQRFQPY